MIIPHMGIATATCCSCGSPVTVCEGSGYVGQIWQALCHDCYDGTEDAGERAHVRGFGATVDDALWDWQDKHDAAHEVEWCLADLFGELARQMSEERDRQRSLGMRQIQSDTPVVGLNGPVLPIHFERTL
jgi:hypothetical protein